MPIRSEIGSGERCYKNLLTEFKDVLPLFTGR